MRFHTSYIIIPLITIIVALIGRMSAVNCDAKTWYRSLTLPIFTPPQQAFSFIWQLIFFLTAFAAIIVWNSFSRTINFWAIISLFITNAILNILWTFLFFDQHQIGIALADAVALAASTLGLTVLIARQSKITSLLIVPYLLWSVFAIYLNAMIWVLNH